MRHITTRLLSRLMMGLCLCGLSAHAVSIDDFHRQFHQDEYQTLLVGEQSIAFLDSPGTLPLTRGVAIILVEPGLSGFNLSGGMAVSRLLNQKGWRTLLVSTQRVSSQMQDIAPATAPQPETADQDNTPNNTQDTSTNPLQPNQSVLHKQVDYTQQRQYIFALINALYGYAQQYTGYTFIISQGMTAATLLDMSNTGELDAPDTLIAVSPYWPEREQNNKVIQWVANSPYPLLDISIASINQWQNQTQDRRRQAAQAGLKVHYRQRQFPAIGRLVAATPRMDQPDAVWLGKEIYSWLRYLGW